MSLEYLFHPRSIAIAGVSQDSTAYNAARQYMQCLIDSGFKGNIYPVNPNGGEILGRKIHVSVNNIPDVVDYVIAAIPARQAPSLVADCAAKGAKAIHYFTSGFGEIEDKEGERLESETLRLALQNNIRILGPNCMGVYCPESGVSFAASFPGQQCFPKQSGPVGLISQSGTNSIYCVRDGNARGVLFSKVISYGNAADLNEADFLEYLADDPKTEIIAAYIEGIRDGSRFFHVLKRAARAKPVIICKAGTTDTGTRAVISHTGVMAGTDKVWQGLLRQAGAIPVHSIEEIIDVALLLLRVPTLARQNVALIGVGGGPSIQAADICSNASLFLPHVPPQMRQRLSQINGGEAGRGFSNPIDLPFFVTAQKDIFIDTVRTVADWDMVDWLVLHMAFDAFSIWHGIERLVPHLESLLEMKNHVAKPIIIVLYYIATSEARSLFSKAQEMLVEAGYPVYPAVARAANALSRIVEYRRRQNDHQ